ncbi:FAD-dependent oxidoreductase [Kibdelosporangium persicum]|uniref:AMP-dependent synthetase and ligase n=1 Tax=Kibdelosporangium persicum TaxID=2698649 RepID=A0ABX2F9F8_9PSEU|nr:FAD-dependent oxidoreductase [Kibdelosporangium persicum]NRN67947.1 AMP-dependent synthetase and ligase [Kibdelosporangium persicum]
MTADRHEALVVGAGPVGMTAALALRALGRSVTVLEAGAQDRLRPGSRAIFVHGVTLGVLDRSCPGLADTLAAHGVLWHTKRTFYEGREVFRRSYPPPAPGRLPHFTSLPQVDTERHLLQACKAAGVEFAWNNAVTGAESTSDGVVLTTAEGARWQADYVIAADGASSSVRKAIGTVMAGDRSDGWYIVVDTEEDPADPLPVERVFHYGHPAVDGRNVLLVPFAGGWRVDLQLHDTDDPEELRQGDGLRSWLRAVMPPAYAERVTWASSYQFLQVVADDFADPHRRVLLVGEAAHLFAPFGARGMNSGVPDADAAATAVHLALSTPVRARAIAAVEDFAISRRRAALFNRDAAGVSLEHLRPDDEVRARQRAAAEGAADDEKLGHWLDIAPYGPREAPPANTIYRY